MEAKTYKKLVEMIAEIKTEEEIWIAGGQINRSFENGK